MTSRSEYRLILRQDNADLRLTEKGYQIGLVTEERYQRFLERQARLEEALTYIRTKRFTPTQTTNDALKAANSAPITTGIGADQILKRPEMTYEKLTTLTPFAPALTDEQAAEQVEIQVKYEGYIARQQDEIEKQLRNENTLLPATLDYRQVSGLSNEVIAKLNDHKPASIGQASRISGVTPAAISILLVWLKKQGMLRRSA